MTDTRSHEPQYVQGKMGLIIGSSLLNALSYVQLDNSIASLQGRLFTCFQGMFVAPGLFAQVSSCPLACL